MDELLFRIRRHDPAQGGSPYHQAFLVRVSVAERMSVLDGLLQIQDEQDATLAFRTSCRWAVCGSCAVVINGRPALACRTQLQGLGRRILIGPLRGLKVIRDLVVDMEPFWESYRSITPWLESAEPSDAKELLLSEKARGGIDQYVNCILCAACYGACPVVRMDGDRKVFLGPAALAKAYRFVADPRDGRPQQRLRHVDSQAGAWGCHQVQRCTLHCPKGVRPSDGIMAIRRSILAHRLGRLSRP